MELGILGALLLLLGANPICLCAFYDFYGAVAIACALLFVVAIVIEVACVIAVLVLPSWVLWLSKTRVDRNLPLRGGLLCGIFVLRSWFYAATGVPRGAQSMLDAGALC